MTDDKVEPQYWGYEIAKMYLEDGFLDQRLNRQGMPSILTIKSATGPDRQIPASEFGKEAGQIMLPSWAAHPNVGLEMGVTALRRLMAHETIWSHSVLLTEEKPLDEQVLNAVKEIKEYMPCNPKRAIIYVAKSLSMAIKIRELRDMREKMDSWCESIHLDIYNTDEDNLYRKVYIWCA